MLVVGGKRGEKHPLEVGGVTLNGCLGPAIDPPVVPISGCHSAAVKNLPRARVRVTGHDTNVIRAFFLFVHSEKRFLKSSIKLGK